MEQFDARKVIEEARMNWIPINSQIREEIVWKVSLTFLDLQDVLWQWGILTHELFENIFHITEVKKRPYEFYNNIHVSVTYEFDLDLTFIDRKVYSILDFLGDVGGLGQALFFMGSFFLAILQYNKLDSLLVNELFRIKAKPLVSSNT